MGLYVVTAVNALTGEREAISAPRSLDKSKRLQQKWNEMTKDCQDPAWRDLKVERYRIDNEDGGLLAL